MNRINNNCKKYDFFWKPIRKIDDFHAEWSCNLGTTKQGILFSWNKRKQYLLIEGSQYSCFYKSEWKINLHINTLRNCRKIDITFPEINEIKIRRGALIEEDLYTSIKKDRNIKKHNRSYKKDFNIDSDELIWREGKLLIRNKKNSKLRSIPDSFTTQRNIHLIMNPKVLKQIIKERESFS